MSVIGGVLLFAAGVAVGGCAVAYNRECVRSVQEKALEDWTNLKRELDELRIQDARDRAYRKGYSRGRKDPLTDAERLAKTFEGRNVEIRSRKGA